MNFTAKLIFLVLPVVLALLVMVSWIAYVAGVAHDIDEKTAVLSELRGDIMTTAVISTQYSNAVEYQIADTMQSKRADIKQILTRITSKKSWTENHLLELVVPINEIVAQLELITAIIEPGQDIADESGFLSDMAQDIYKSLSRHSLEYHQEKIDLNERFGMKEMAIMVISIIIFVSLLVFLIARRITQPINQAVLAMHDIAEGEGVLTQRLTVTSQDELGQLSSGFNTFIAKIQELILDVKDAMSNINTSSNEIAAGSSNLSERTNRQTSALQQTSISIDKMADAVANNADNSKAAEKLALAAQTNARKGGDIINSAVVAMKGVASSNNEMEEIINTIDGLAFQTNLLALNAAIESALAGDRGRGFSVVASEVRGLAKKSADAAKKIKSLITNNLTQIHSAHTLVDESGEILKAIVESSNKVSEIVTGISTACQEQTLDIKAVNNAIVQMEDVTQENMALVEEFTATTQSTRRQVESLTQLLYSFKA